MLAEKEVREQKIHFVALSAKIDDKVGGVVTASISRLSIDLLLHTLLDFELIPEIPTFNSSMITQSGTNSKSTPHELAAGLLKEMPLLQRKLSKALFCSPVDCEDALAEVIKFMALAAECTDTQVTPSSRVDLAWHEFILFTRTYSRFCDENFGKMIHHEPSDDRERNARQYAQTLKRYHLRFGIPPAEYWAKPIHSKELADFDKTTGGSAYCGNCESDS